MIHLHRSLLILILGLLYFGSAVLTSAAPVVVIYTDRTVYNLAATSTATINFEGIAAANSFTDFSNATGLTVSGATFVGTEGSGHHLLVIDSGLSAQYNYGTGAVLEGPSSIAGLGGVLTMTLPGGVTAFGTDVMSKAAAPDFNPATFLPGATLTITFADGNVQTLFVPTFPRDPLTGPAFFGITSDTAILSVAFSAPSLPTGLGNADARQCHLRHRRTRTGINVVTGHWVGRHRRHLTKEDEKVDFRGQIVVRALPVATPFLIAVILGLPVRQLRKEH